MICSDLASPGHNNFLMRNTYAVFMSYNVYDIVLSLQFLLDNLYVEHSFLISIQCLVHVTPLMMYKLGTVPGARERESGCALPISSQQWGEGHES